MKRIHGMGKRALAALIAVLLGVLSAPATAMASGYLDDLGYHNEDNVLYQEVEMYRLYNQWTGEHLYTSSSFEKDYLQTLGWTYEGVGWYAPVKGDPVYRLYNPYAPGGDHHFTMDEEERDKLVDIGWTYEGVGWCSGGDVALLRQFNPYELSSTHNYTTDPAERDMLVDLGWDDEGTAWMAVGAGHSEPGREPLNPETVFHTCQFGLYSDDTFSYGWTTDADGNRVFGITDSTSKSYECCWICGSIKIGDTLYAFDGKTYHLNVAS